MAKLMSKPRLPVLSGLSRPAHDTSVSEIPSRPDVDGYLLSFEVDNLSRRRTRHHWMICSADSPNQLLSWGHAPTTELAETDAKSEMDSLSSGLTQGGQVKRTVMPFSRRTCAGY
jgi:hypothetical protein